MNPGAKAREWVKRGIELRHFAALEAVAGGASQPAGPSTLGYAVRGQPADRGSGRIVGQKLVHRPGGQRAVTLTEAGALLSSAHAIGTRLAAAEADLEALAEGARDAGSAASRLRGTDPAGPAPLPDRGARRPARARSR